MSFLDTTRDKLMGILAWPVSSKDYIDYLQALMDDVVSYGGEDAIARIESLVLDYEAAQTALLTLTTSTQASMTKADVIEWNPRLTMGAARSRIGVIAAQIKAALGLNLDPLGWDCECASTLRLRKG